MSKYLLKIKIIDDSMKHYYQNHKSAYNTDSGVDLFVSEDYCIPASYMSFKLLSGVQLEMINTEEKIEDNKELSDNKEVGYMLVPRSSMIKTGLRTSIPIGIIDAGYRGEIVFYVDNLTNENIFIKKGTRLFQVVGPGMIPIHLKIVDKLSDSERGWKGFGSSGMSKL